MPTLVNIFTPEEIKLRYRELYFSAGINTKFTGVVARGVYRGYELTSNPIKRNTVTIKADARMNDHSLIHSGSSGFSLTLRRSGGDFSLDLGSLVTDEEKTWVIAVTAAYTVGMDTIASIQAYELSPTDEFSSLSEELIVLGTVTIPANNLAILPENNVSPANRVAAWEEIPTDSARWLPQVVNGGFNVSLSDNVPYWEIFSTWDVVTDDLSAHTGTSYLKRDSTTLSSTEFNTQAIGSELNESARDLRVLVYKRVIEAASVGSGMLRLIFKDSLGSEIIKEVLFDIQSVDSDYVPVDLSVRIDAAYVLIDRLELGVSNASWATNGNEALRVDDIQLWLEPRSGPARGHSSLEHAYLSLHGKSNALPRIKTISDATKFVLLHESSQPNGESYRIYQEGSATGAVGSSGPALWHTINASYSNNFSRWAKDTNGDTASAMRIGSGPGAFLMLVTNAVTSIWNTYEWSSPTPLDVSDTFCGILGGLGDNGIELNRGYGSDANSMLVWKAGSDIRYYIDRLGFPPHQLKKIFNYWEALPGVGVANDRNWDIGGNGTAIVNTSNYWPGRQIELDASSGDTVDVHTQGTSLWKWGATAVGESAWQSLVFSMRWQAVWANSLVGAESRMGITASNNFGSPVGNSIGYWFKYEQAADNQIVCVSKGSSGSNEFITGIVPVLASPRSFRLDFIGDSFEGGFQVMFYVDGTLVRTETNSDYRPITDDNALMSFRHHNDGGPGDARNLIIGPVVLQYYMPSLQRSWNPNG